jgi:microcin C transport system substrate-binding protein
LRLTRRSIIRTGLVAAASPVLGRLAAPLAAPANAQEAQWRHGVSLFGDLKYPPGFKHFEYVNPDAPKGGVVRLNAIGTFDNFNLAVGSTRGSLAGLLTELYNTLLVSSLDEISTEYGLLAEAMTFPADFSSATFRLRPTARFHDGKPVTVADVIFSFDTFKKSDPQLAAYYQHVVEAKQTGEREVTFTFDGPGNRELPTIIGQLTVMPKHWWEGTGADGKKRDVSATTLEPPLGNGGYRIKSFVPGRSIVYERVKDYWGKDLNVNIGRDNFDEVRIEYFRDSTVALEAFKADQIDWRLENSALFWATRYDFPAMADKRVVREEFDIRNVGIMQAMAFNTRRDKFKDPRVRRAFNYAYDFEEMNKQIFFGQYFRIASYFEGTELAWHGERAGTGYTSERPPQGQELEILETVRGKVPPEVFTTPYKNPAGGNPEAVRSNLREATRLLREAGYEIRNQKLVNVKTGEPLAAEFLSSDPGLERIFLFYKPQLERLGITVTLRTIDDAQYENRLRQWDFDIIMNLWPESLSPGNEQRDFWGSPAADQPGSRNVVGIKDPAVDALIERVIFAKNREELVAATRALDRVLMWNHYVIPQYTYGKVRAARWDRFGRPAVLPKYGNGAFPFVWFWDAEKAAKTGSRQ